MKRITAIVGHYGSGKTEVAVNLAVKESFGDMRVALVDLDIANPYFRSRERQATLESRGIEVYFNTFGYDIGEDIPAIAATIRRPLEDKAYRVIMDAGGNDSGAGILTQFQKYLLPRDSEVLCVINGNRPETETTAGCLAHISAIECQLGRKIDGLINNTHLLMETRPKDILKGFDLCKELSDITKKPFLFSALQKGKNLEIIIEGEAVLEMDLYMRPHWLDALAR